MLLLAWVRIVSAIKSLPKGDNLTESKQVAGITFNFCLLAAGLAGLGRHALGIHRNLYVLLDKVSQTQEDLTTFLGLSSNLSCM